MTMSSSFTITQALQKSVLLESVSDSTRLDVEVLLAHILQKDRAYLYTWPEKILSQEQENDFLSAIQRRIKGEPIAYIIGEKEFWSLTLTVDPSTLIPRPDTEILVETALGLFSDDVNTLSRTVIDLGTGTGAIALALASEKSQWQIMAVDVSEAACELAEKNRQRYQFCNVSVQQSCWLDSVEMMEVDMIVSNPPYIDSHDPHLSQGDVRFEPHSALVAANQGLADIETIVKQAQSHLTHNGYLLIEHGYQQADAARAIFQQYHYHDIVMVKDMANNPRITVGQLTRE